MNKYLPLCLLALSTSSFALDNFDVNTNILTVPEVRAGDVIYKNVIIELNDYSVLSFDSQIEVYSGGVEYVGSITFPHKDNISFNSHTTGDTLALSDGSLWSIVGTHSSGQNVLHSHDVTVYTNTDSISVPVSGRRSNYYMHISGSSRSFFIEPINEVVIKSKDNISFNSNTTGDTLALSDGSLWSIVGTHSSGQNVLHSHDVTIYTNTDSISVSISVFGRRSDYYMYISGSSRSFFVEPI